MYDVYNFICQMQYIYYFDFYDIVMQYNYEYINFFQIFFFGKCWLMKILKLGNIRYEKKIFKKKLDFFYNIF